VWNVVQFYWFSCRGYRLQPWKSPFIQWRFETFLGKEAANLTPQKFFQLSWKYRQNLKSFADWAAHRRRSMHSRP
jgi:hypothetical protein